MNTIATIKITRPPEISDEDPCPIVLKDTFKLNLQALWLDGRPVDLTGSKVYLTVKAALTDIDASAKYQKNSTANPTIVVVATGTNGRYTIIVPVGDLSDGGVVIDTNYYVDTYILLASSGGGFTHLYDIIRPFKGVTDAET
jgi:hypothetical protein